MTIKSNRISSHCFSSSQEFNVKAKNQHQNDLKRVWLFTNDDSPNWKDPQEQKNTWNVSKDCAETGVEISLWHMNFCDAKKDFDFNKFYSKLLTAEEDEVALRVRGAGDDGFPTMLAHARRKENKKRRLGSLKFVLGDAEGAGGSKPLQLQVELYKVICPATKAANINLDRTTNLPLKIVSKYIDENGKHLDDEDISTYFETLGSRVYMNPKELTRLKQLGFHDAYLQLLYFIDVSALTPEMNTTSPYFVCPDDGVIKGIFIRSKPL